MRGVRPAASMVSLVMWRSGLRQSEGLAGVSWRCANTVGRPCGVRRPSAETPEPESKENAEAEEVREGIEGGSRKATLSFPTGRQSKPDLSPVLLCDLRGPAVRCRVVIVPNARAGVE